MSDATAPGVTLSFLLSTMLVDLAVLRALERMTRGGADRAAVLDPHLSRATAVVATVVSQSSGDLNLACRELADAITRFVAANAAPMKWPPVEEAVGLVLRKADVPR